MSLSALGDRGFVRLRHQNWKRQRTFRGFDSPTSPSETQRDTLATHKDRRVR